MKSSRTWGRCRAVSRRGGALVFVLVSMLGLIALVIMLQHLGLRTDSRVNARVDDRLAFYLAEAALSEGMTAVRAGSTGSVATPELPAFLSGGVIWVEATPVDDTHTRLVANAMAGGGRAAMEAFVEMVVQDPLFEAVLNSREEITLASAVVVDSFDSSVGTYASQAVNTSNGHIYANAEGDVTSNASIVLNNDATVFGDATPGPGESVVFNSGSYVSGSIDAAPEPFSFPTVEAPDVVSTGPLNIPNNTSTSLGPGVHSLDDLTIGKNAALTVTGPATVVVDDFSGGRNGRLFIDASNGPVTFFVQGSYTHLLEFEALPVDGSPMAVAFMIEGTQDIVFPNLTNVRGAYYAPNANILFGNDNEAWGSFAANKITMSSTMRFHYDEDLASHWDSDGQDVDPLRLILWRPIAFERRDLMRNRRDPFSLLGVTPADLPRPADAWDA